MTPVHLLRIAIAIVCLATLPLSARGANPSRPMVGPGATKEDVINAYGWPNGQSQTGTKEILSYAQGEVVLENGRVERVNFSPNIPWQAPRPRPGPPTASTRKVPEAPVDYWVGSYDTATAEAQRRGCRILALFTGSDWSPASREFHDEVEYQPDFVNAFAGDFVFLKLDYPRGNPVPVKISEENLALRDRYGVTTYPTLLVLSAAGDLLGRVAWENAAGPTFRDRMITAVRAARDAAAAGKPAPPAGAREKATEAKVAAGAVEAPAPRIRNGSPAMSGLLGASKLIFGALALGLAVVAFVLWRLWRQPRAAGPAAAVDMHERIDAAAGGMPSGAEINRWTAEKLRAVTAALAEFDNYAAHIRPAGGDVDVELRKRGDVNPRVLVSCSAGSAGIVPAKRVRELFGSIAAEGAESGWFVSPAGFSSDARDYAAAHRIVLIGIDGLHAMMRDVPPVSLPGVLARE